jgi:hypothetical protein
MIVRLHPHAVQRLAERGATRDEVVYTVKHGTASPAKFGRTQFTHVFAYNRRWRGTIYRSKRVEAFAAEVKKDEWLVITVVVKFIGRTSR